MRPSESEVTRGKPQAMDELTEDGVEIKSSYTFSRWLLVPLSIATYAMTVGIPLSLSVMFLDWQQTFQTTRAYTAVIHSTWFGMAYGPGVLGGYMVSRFGARVSMMCGSILASTGFLLSMFATSVNFLIITTGVMGGFGCCLIFASVVPCLTKLVSEKFRGLALSLCTLWGGTIVATFPRFYEYVTQFLSWREVFAIKSGIMLQNCIFAIMITSAQKKEKIFSSKTSAAESIEDRKSVTPERVTLRDRVSSESNVLGPSQKVGIGKAFNIQNDSVKAGNKTKKNIFSRIRESRWGFILDGLFVAFIVHVSFCFSCIFAFPILLTDLAKSKGFGESVGFQFITTVFASSMPSRIFVGVLTIYSRIHSIVLYTAFSMLCAAAMLLMSFTDKYELMITFLAMYGLGYGAVIALFMKCVVDIKAVNRTNSLPLALGFSSTALGIFVLIMPVTMGYSVDSTGSYSTILIILGCVILVVSALLGAKFWNLTKQEKALQPQVKDEEMRLESESN